MHIIQHTFNKVAFNTLFFMKGIYKIIFIIYYLARK
nr:MAG TPA: hypothetical protein [Caudoviricetes sp.]DAM70858.1 MAG TPA: hypothetical protein [Caudoviricetes sp.]